MACTRMHRLELSPDALQMRSWAALFPVTSFTYGYAVVIKQRFCDEAVGWRALSADFSYQR